MSRYTYLKGINLGGWLSQYLPGTDLDEHYANFITEKDIDVIASWGADHVRLPFESGVLDDKSLRYMDKCVTWCGRRGLGVIFDLHFVKGMTFDPNRKFNTLFLPENTQRMLNVWDSVSRHFAGADNGVRYELLNEITDGTGYLWNRLYPQVLAVIRSREPERVVYIGSNKMNDVNELCSLTLTSDEHIIYNFHYYEPNPFTHQNAPFDEDMRTFAHAYGYPCEFSGLYDYMTGHPAYASRYPNLVFQRNDEAQMAQNLNKAADFMHYTQKPLYCGEFGVINHTDPAATAAYLRDLIRELRRLGIGYACWCYKQMDFGLVNAAGKLILPLLPEIIFGM
ncbi:MAG: glycoside hydrolase family 5 protein [Eubacteriales bacterium]|nr:glycoside hydrolase family 5 protein [Eubacteriales bacterium]